MHRVLQSCWLSSVLWLLASGLLPADDWSTIYGSICREARQISSSSMAIPYTAGQWTATEAQRRERWMEMLGLSPLPERTPLQAEVTGSLDRGDYVVEKVHFQSVPGAYVIGNLYRPAKVTGRLPAVLYLCGHSKGKVNAPYQANPRWFAQHDYIALVLDPIQLGESQGLHHGTYREGRWDWQSRGYSPIGTEVWNGMRALDYLESREDVDADRLGVTGLSGGGVVSWCLGAADPRLKVVVPVCQSGSIEHVAVDRATDGHCDCAFWINTYRWCWPDIGALIAPRAFLIASGSEDVLWRPYAYRDVAHRIRHQYAALDVSDKFDLVEDLTPHGYTPKLRQAIFTFFNTHLKNDPTPVTDDVTTFVEPEENLQVFDGELPQRDQMRQIDKLLVARPALPTLSPGFDWKAYQAAALQRLRDTTFRYTLSGTQPQLRDVRADGSDGTTIAGSYVFESFDRMTLAMRTLRPAASPTDQSMPVMLAHAMQPEAQSAFGGGGSSRPRVRGAVATATIEVRNTGATSVGTGYLWTARRTFPLLGETLAERQVCDLLAGIRVLREQRVANEIAVYGKGYTAPLAIYAALLDDQISEVVLADVPVTHEDPATAPFLGVLKVGDLPHNLALLYPRRITFIGAMPPAFQWTKDVYEKYGASDKIRTAQVW
ncbi:MAG: acetylxylan esterase [Pirellulaceae bacterium]|nr:acetylxylan esterase [Pirellulaceae bacterium]